MGRISRLDGIMDVLRMTGVSLRFPSTGREILKDISWTVGAGEKWVLFGRNGAGKSKLLEVITGYQSPSSGTVIRYGRERGDVRDARKRIGYTGSALRNMFPRRDTSLEVVLSGLDGSIGLYRSFSGAEIGEVRRLMRDAAMERLESAPFCTLSDGEKQRVLMLRAAFPAPDLLVLDEPAEGLDFGAREDLLETLEKLTAARPAALIYVTHHVEEITPLFSMLFMLHEGAAAVSGRIEEVLTEKTLTRVFGRTVRLRRAEGRYHAYRSETGTALAGTGGGPIFS